VFFSTNASVKSSGDYGDQKRRNSLSAYTTWLVQPAVAVPGLTGLPRL
jgi:hypothetical protein